MRIFNIDLDKNQYKWNEVIESYRNEIIEIHEFIKTKLMNGWILTIFNLCKALYSTFGGSIYYSEELKEIAKQTGISFNEILFLQLIYELNAHCTSVIFDTKQYGNILFRTIIINSFHYI